LDTGLGLNTRFTKHFGWQNLSCFNDSEKAINMTDAVQTQLAILRRKQVLARTGLSRSTIYLYIKAGAFPKPVALGPRAVGWLESDVNGWLAARVAETRDEANCRKR